MNTRLEPASIGHSKSQTYKSPGNDTLPKSNLLSNYTPATPKLALMQCNTKFNTLTAINPLLRWVQRHPYPWLELMSSNFGLAPYCQAAGTHFLDNRPQSPSHDSKLTHIPLNLENPLHQYAVGSIKVAALELPGTTNTSAYPVKAIILDSATTRIRPNLPDNEDPVS